PRIRLAAGLHEHRRAALAHRQDPPRLGVTQDDRADVDPLVLVVDHRSNRAVPSYSSAVRIRSSISPATPALSSSRTGHHQARTFSPSAGYGSPLTHRHRSTVSKNWARSPLTNDCGGNECTQTSASVRATTPASSSTSRSAATAGCSPGSRMPVTGVMRPLSARSTRSTSSSRTTTAVTPASHNSSCPIFSRNRRMKSGVAIDRAYLPTDLCEPRVQPVAHRRPLAGKDRVDDRVSDVPVRQDPVTAKDPVLLRTESLDRGARLTVVEVSPKLDGDA